MDNTFKVGDSVAIDDVRYAFGSDANDDDMWLSGKEGKIKAIRSDGYCEVELEHYDVNVYVRCEGLELIDPK